MTRQPVPATWNREPLTLDALLAWGREGLNGCIEWTRSLNADGYGRAMCEGTRWMVHRLVWAVVNGPIPEGMEIDHTCFNPACINPGHLRPLPALENRGRHLASLRETCARGHRYDDGNLYFTRGAGGKRYRRCRACHRIYVQRYKRRLTTRGAA